MPAWTLSPEGGSLVGEEKETPETPFTRVWKPSPSIHILKTLRGKPERKNLKRTLSGSGGLGSLH